MIYQVTLGIGDRSPSVIPRAAMFGNCELQRHLATNVDDQTSLRYGYIAAETYQTATDTLFPSLSRHSVAFHCFETVVVYTPLTLLQTRAPMIPAAVGHSTVSS